MTKTAIASPEDSFEKIRRNQKNYLKTEKGRIAISRYLKSNKGKTSIKKYLASDRGKEARLRYNMSEKGIKNREAQILKAKLASECLKFMENNPGKTPVDFFNTLTTK